MDFLIAAFQRVLEHYNFVNFSLTKHKNGTYSLDMYDLPSELDYLLITSKYRGASKEIEIPIGKGKVIHELRPNEIIIFSPSRNGEKNIIHTDLSIDDYAAKINKIEAVLRQYSRIRHPRKYI